MSTKIPQVDLYIDRAELALIEESVHNRWLTEGLYAKAFEDAIRAQNGCLAAFTYTHDEVRQELLQGYEVLSIEQEHIFPFVIQKYIKYEYKIVSWFGAMPREMFRVLEKSLGWHKLVVARLAR